LMQKRHDFQLVFRHLPLEFHPLARPAANLSELAADKGKFWNFTSQRYGGEGGSEDNLVAMANALGVKNAGAQMNDNSNKAVKRVDAGLALAHRLGLHS